MSSFHDVLLPDSLAYGVKFGPAYKTTVVTTESGAEQRIGHWARARRQGTITFDPNPTQAAALLAFFLARHGRLFGFRFSDVNDRTATAEVLVNTGGTSLSLQKTYTSGGISVVRAITKPSRTWPFLLYKNGALMTTGYTLDVTTGVVTLGQEAPGAAFSWSGQFDTPIRFDTDIMDTTRETMTSLTWTGIPIIELLS